MSSLSVIEANAVADTAVRLLEEERAARRADLETVLDGLGVAWVPDSDVAELLAQVLVAVAQRRDGA